MCNNNGIKTDGGQEERDALQSITLLGWFGELIGTVQTRPV